MFLLEKMPALMKESLRLNSGYSQAMTPRPLASGIRAMLDSVHDNPPGGYIE